MFIHHNELGRFLIHSQDISKSTSVDIKDISPKKRKEKKAHTTKEIEPTSK